VRIEIDPGLEKMLDGVKSKEGSIGYSRGHAETVRFLAEYYREHQNISALLKQFEAEQEDFFAHLDSRLAQALERVFPKAIARALTNVLTATAEPQPPVDPAAGQLRSVR
jgi:sulfur relay (sulfurtransferase) DsrC/TusE family protein